MRYDLSQDRAIATLKRNTINSLLTDLARKTGQDIPKSLKYDEEKNMYYMDIQIPTQFEETVKQSIHRIL